MPLALPTSRAEIDAIQSRRKVVAVEQARRAPFYRGRLDQFDIDRLDDPAEWAKIPILDKEALRAPLGRALLRELLPRRRDGIAEYWRSGGATGKPLFYPRSFTDIRYGLLSFARTFACAASRRGERAHNSFPLGIHPAGQIYRARRHDGRHRHELGRRRDDDALAAAARADRAPEADRLDGHVELRPAPGQPGRRGRHRPGRAQRRLVLCSAEPLRQAKRAKLERTWGARVRDTFGMTEAGMMGAEDAEGPDAASASGPTCT